MGVKSLVNGIVSTEDEHQCAHDGAIDTEVHEFALLDHGYHPLACNASTDECCDEADGKRENLWCCLCCMSGQIFFAGSKDVLEVKEGLTQDGWDDHQEGELC